jgi:hypothetical protein
LTEDDEELEELLPDIYVEITTGLLYECKFFDTFVLVRPASPSFYLAIKKMSLTDFVGKFDEFCGDRDEARIAIRGGTPEFIVDKV